MTRRRLCAILALQALGAATRAQTIRRTQPFPDDMIARVRAILDAVYRMDYTRAEALCRQYIREQPEHPAGYVYLARTYWSQDLNRARLLSIERFAAADFFVDSPDSRVTLPPEITARFDQASTQAIEVSRVWLKQHEGDPGAMYLLGVAYQNSASYAFSLERSWWKAATLGNQTYDAHRQLLRKFPDFADARVATGTIGYIAGSLPWHLRSLGLLLGFRGNRDQGIRDLEMAADAGTLARDDAKTLLAILYARAMQWDKSLSRLTELHSRYPENQRLHLDMGAVNLLRNEPGKAAGIYADILERSYPGLERALVLSRHGVALRMAGDLAASERSLREAAGESEASADTRAIARLELGKTLDFRGQRSAAMEQYRIVATDGNPRGLRQEAEQLLRRPPQRPGPQPAR